MMIGTLSGNLKKENRSSQMIKGISTLIQTRRVAKKINLMKVFMAREEPNNLKDGTLEVAGMVEIKGKISDRNIMINRNSIVTHVDITMVKTMAMIIEIIMIKDKIEEDKVNIGERRTINLGMIRMKEVIPVVPTMWTTVHTERAGNTSPKGMEPMATLIMRKMTVINMKISN